MAVCNVSAKSEATVQKTRRSTRSKSRVTAEPESVTTANLSASHAPVAKSDSIVDLTSPQTTTKKPIKKNEKSSVAKKRQPSRKKTFKEEAALKGKAVLLFGFRYFEKQQCF